jgi:hypothetical protein
MRHGPQLIELPFEDKQIHNIEINKIKKEKKKSTFFFSNTKNPLIRNITGLRTHSSMCRLSCAWDTLLQLDPLLPLWSSGPSFPSFGKHLTVTSEMILISILCFRNVWINFFTYFCIKDVQIYDSMNGEETLICLLICLIYIYIYI